MANITATTQFAGMGEMALAKLTGIDRKLIEKVQDTYEISYNELENSILEGNVVLDYYHNRQWTDAQMAVLKGRGQPTETFNIVKMLAHAMVGYFDTIANQISVEPRHKNSSSSAMLVNDSVQYVQDTNDFETIRRQLQLDSLLTGLCVTYETVEETGQTDDYGRKKYKINLERVPSWQVRIDPMARKDDMSDARFIHRFKWLPQEEIAAKWGKKKLLGLTEYYNDRDGDGNAEWFREFNAQAIGKYRQWNNYLVLHSVVEHDGATWEVVWSNYTILEKKKVSFKKVKSPYRAVKLFESDRSGYYGAFREVIEPQKAINQALIQIQLLINTSKAFVETNSVNDVDEFKKSFNAVNGVVVVSDLAGVKIEDMSKDVLQQYSIIDKALERVKAVLGINDSFLGQAFASDSGRKVQMQANSSASQLSIMTDRVKYMNKMIGWDIVNLIQQYFTAEDMIRVADPVNGGRYININQPIQMPTGEIDPRTGEPLTEPVFEPEYDPETGDYLTSAEGAIIMTPLNSPDTDIKYAEVHLKVVASPANNAEERNQLLLETFINGPIGQSMLQMNPAGYMKTAALMVQEFGTKHSPAIAEMLRQTGAMIEQGEIDPTFAMSGGDMQSIMGEAMGGQGGGGNAVAGKKSQALQVPTRFNNPQGDN